MLGQNLGQFRSDLNLFNQQLKRVSIRIRGERLSIRATLPPKPGEIRPTQRDIATGELANHQGLLKAFEQAKSLDEQLDQGIFSWGDLRQRAESQENTVGYWLEKFEENYWESRPKTLKKLSTWKACYEEVYRRLDPTASLTPEILKAEILKTNAATRNREKICVAYQALARFAGLETNFSKLAKNCKAKIRRNIPSDKEIEEIRLNIQHPGWRWLFSILACYGIRPHESFHLDCSRMREEPGFLTVLEDTKTGERLVPPLFGSWWKEWKLWERVFPDFVFDPTVTSNQQLGARISPGFHRHGCLLTAYHLRDAYACRGIRMGIDPATLSRWMGHDLDVFYRYYHRHLAESQYIEIWKKAHRINQY